MLEVRESSIAPPAIVPSMFSASVPPGQCGACDSTLAPEDPPGAVPSLEPHATSSEHAQVAKHPVKSRKIPNMFRCYAKMPRLLPYFADRWQNPPNFYHVRTAHHHLHEDRRG